MMNDTILRGFCKECDAYWTWKEFSQKEKEGLTCHGTESYCEPVWFLSAKQMRVVYKSEEYSKWFEENLNLIRPLPFWENIARFLEDMPFLVAKIIKEAEKK